MLSGHFRTMPVLSAGKLAGVITDRDLRRHEGYLDHTDEQGRRQAFSENAISEHDASWLTERLAETVPEAEFWFYFRDLSSNPLKDCKEILSHLGMTAILPVVRIERPLSTADLGNDIDEFIEETF